MNKIILKLSEERFNFFKYILFTYLKCNKIYDKNIEKNVFFVPFKKTLKSAYIRALSRFLKGKNIKEIMCVEKGIKKHFQTEFSIINGINIYRTIFCDVLNFVSNNKLFDYEIIFISDNIKEIKFLAEKCVKNVKTLSVLTNKPYLYESMRDYFFEKYGVMLNIKVKKDKLKKHNKIYVNAGGMIVFDKALFKNINLIDIYGVYEGGFNEIIFENNKLSKEYTKLLKCPYCAALADFLEQDKSGEKIKIVNIKK